MQINGPEMTQHVQRHCPSHLHERHANAGSDFEQSLYMIAVQKQEKSLHKHIAERIHTVKNIFHSSTDY